MAPAGDPYVCGLTSGTLAPGVIVSVPVAPVLTALQAGALKRGDFIIVGYNTLSGFTAQVATNAVAGDAAIAVISTTTVVAVPSGAQIVNPLFSADYV